MLGADVIYLNLKWSSVIQYGLVATATLLLSKRISLFEFVDFRLYLVFLLNIVPSKLLNILDCSITIELSLVFLILLNPGIRLDLDLLLY